MPWLGPRRVPERRHPGLSFGILRQAMNPTRFVERLSPSSLRLAAAFLALAGMILLYLATDRETVLLVDGRVVQIRTHARTVGGALHDAGWELTPADRVIPDTQARLLQGMTIRLDRAQTVLVEIDGEVSAVETAETAPANILAAAGVRLYPGDRVWSDGIRTADPAQVPGRRPRRIRLETASPITLIVDGANRQLRSAAPMLGEALWEAGITLHSADRLEPGPQTPIDGPLTATLRTARPVIVLAEGARHDTRVAASTVGEALAQIGLTPIGLDYAVPAITEPVPEDGQIRLIRVREQFLVEQEPLPFETTYQAIADLEIDNQRLVNPGAYGVTIHRVRLRLEDGQEVNRSVEGEWVAVEPQDRVVGYGTQIVIRTLSTPEGTLEYWRAVTMYATSYSPSRAGTSPDAPWYGITASGKPLTKGLVAIDRSLIPFGTRMYVPGYGQAEAADVGGGIRGRWIDLGYDDGNFINWHQYVTVYFLTPVPPASSIVWTFP